MANKKISQLTAKGTALAATDLVEISESDGAGGYVTKSVTGANVKSGLQPTLVSGTDIKTINSTSLLGSGDLAVQPTLVSGTNIASINLASILGGGNLSLQTPLVSGTDIKTINSNTLLGSGDLVIGSGVHILTTPVSGRTYNARTTGTNGGTAFTPAANTITLYPFIPANTLTVSSLQVSVTTLTAAGLIRILVYSDLNGVPSSKLLESTSLDVSTTGVKTYTAAFTFTAGTTYWLGYYANAALNLMSSVQGVELTPISASAFSAANRTVTATATFPTAPSTLGTATPGVSDAILINLISA
jgi:hypothetical protein